MLFFVLMAHGHLPLEVLLDLGSRSWLRCMTVLKCSVKSVMKRVDDYCTWGAIGEDYYIGCNLITHSPHLIEAMMMHGFIPTLLLYDGYAS